MRKVKWTLIEFADLHGERHLMLFGAKYLLLRMYVFGQNDVRFFVDPSTVRKKCTNSLAFHEIHSLTMAAAEGSGEKKKE
jgi:hypothetical protein